MLDLFDKIQDASKFIAEKWGKTPDVGIILGTGLGPLVSKIKVDVAIDYGDIHTS